MCQRTVGFREMEAEWERRHRPPWGLEPHIHVVADDHGPSLQLAAPIDIGEIRCTEVSFFGRCAPWSHSQASASLHPQTLFGGVSSSTAAGTDPDPKAVSEKGGARCFSPGAQQWGLCGGHPAVPPQ